MNLTCAHRELHPRRPFRISRGQRAEVRNVFVRVEHEGISGYGEASPINFYNETWESVIECLERARDFLATVRIKSVEDIEGAWTAGWRFLAPSRAAQCALDIALWDWLGQRLGLSVAELAWGAPARPITTFCTIGLSENGELIEKVKELRGFPQIKIKSSSDACLKTVGYVRRHSEALLAVDANCAWEGVDLPEVSKRLVDLRVAFIEQPLPSCHDEGLSKSSASLPLMADESCVTEADVDRASERYSACNIKLVKCGGITPALRMVKRCRALGLRSMVGCMLESSALIAAGASVAQGADFADLDGAWLLRDEPFAGWKFELGVLHPPRKPGLGITPLNGVFHADGARWLPPNDE